MAKNYRIFVLSMLLGLSSADQPVHCVNKDIYGEWNFKVSKDQQTVNIFETEDICTHKMPNGVQIIDQDFKFFFAQSDNVKIKIMDKNIAEARFCQSEKDCGGAKLVKGKWSTVYDQALKVELENGERYVTNFRYNVKPSVSTDPLTDQNLLMEDMHAGDYGKFNSDCTQTMVGFVQQIPSITGERHSLKDLKAKCFFGNLERPIDVDGLKDFSTETSKVSSLNDLKIQDSQNKTVPKN